jgi:hypothetical protein
MVPVNRFVFNAKSRSASREDPMAGGMVPTRRFVPKYSAVSLVSEAIDGGIEPVRELLVKVSVLRAVIDPTVDGIVPTSRLE